jgi:hypothetical protein
MVLPAAMPTTKNNKIIKNELIFFKTKFSKVPYSVKGFANLLGH